MTSRSDFNLADRLIFPCLACAVILILVWPLSGTIALRNFALVLGCLAGLTWLYLTHDRINFHALIPGLCLLAVPVWLWIHFLVFPGDSVQRLYDLKGTWLRVTLGIFMATSLGFMAPRRPVIIIWLWAAILFYPLLTFGYYLIEVSQTKLWLLDNFHYPFKYKSAALHFLFYPCMLIYAGLNYYLVSKKSVDKSRHIILASFMILYLVVIWVDFIVCRTLNGILLAGIFGLILLFKVIFHIARERKLHKANFYFLPIAIFVAISSLSFIYWDYDRKYENKLENLVEDAMVGIKIDDHLEWQRNPSDLLKIPKNSLGRDVNESTYLRVAWFVKGAQVLWENPLGAGFSHLAFGYFMVQKDPKLTLLTKTHSGWLDFALGVGIPGILLTWASMGLVWIGATSLKNHPNPLIFAPTKWLLGGVWVLWWLSELSEREFIEYLFFINAFLGTANAGIPEDPKIVN